MIPSQVSYVGQTNTQLLLSRIRTDLHKLNTYSSHSKMDYGTSSRGYGNFNRSYSKNLLEDYDIHDYTIPGFFVPPHALDDGSSYDTEFNDPICQYDQERLVALCEEILARRRVPANLPDFPFGAQQQPRGHPRPLEPLRLHRFAGVNRGIRPVLPRKKYSYEAAKSVLDDKETMQSIMQPRVQHTHRPRPIHLLTGISSPSVFDDDKPVPDFLRRSSDESSGVSGVNNPTTRDHPRVKGKPRDLVSAVINSRQRARNANLRQRLRLDAMGALERQRVTHACEQVPAPTQCNPMCCHSAPYGGPYLIYRSGRPGACCHQAEQPSSDGLEKKEDSANAAADPGNMQTRGTQKEAQNAPNPQQNLSDQDSATAAAAVRETPIEPVEAGVLQSKPDGNSPQRKARIKQNNVPSAQKPPQTEKTALCTKLALSGKRVPDAKYRVIAQKAVPVFATPRSPEHLYLMRRKDQRADYTVLGHALCPGDGTGDKKQRVASCTTHTQLDLDKTATVDQTTLTVPGDTSTPSIHFRSDSVGDWLRK